VYLGQRRRQVVSSCHRMARRHVVSKKTRTRTGACTNAVGSICSSFWYENRKRKREKEREGPKEGRRHGGSNGPDKPSEID